MSAEALALNRLLATLAVAAIAVTFVASPAQTPPRKPMVVVISLDAFGSALLQQPLLPVPTLHALMASGAYATMQPVNPTVTWPNHTSMVTGVVPAKHGLIANGLVTGQRTGGPIKAEFHADKTALVRVPTVYDEAHAAGMTTAEMDWVAIENAKGIDWSFFEQPLATMPLIKAMLADGSLKQDELDNFGKASQPYRDRLYTRGAVYAIEHYHPSLTLLHLLALDSTEHAYGYNASAGVVTAAFLDDRVKEVVDAVRAAGDLDRTTFLIVSDHGQSSVQHTVDPNAVLTAAGIPPADAVAMPEGGATFIYETHATPELSARIRSAFAADPGTDKALTETEATADGFPTPHDAGTPNPSAPDVIVYAKEGWSYGGKTQDQFPATGAHAYPNTRPLMQAIFIGSGAAIRPAGQQPTFRNLDVAATIAQILGLSHDAMDGTPLTAILK
jgi:predicted AlkP superfamily pyrophosphatase or phosphodiesterase